MHSAGEAGIRPGPWHPADHGAFITHPEPDSEPHPEEVPRLLGEQRSEAVLCSPPETGATSAWLTSGSLGPGTPCLTWVTCLSKKGH